jgi:hypothetical protein
VLPQGDADVALLWSQLDFDIGSALQERMRVDSEVGPPDHKTAILFAEVPLVGSGILHVLALVDRVLEEDESTWLRHRQQLLD